jgi:hypothetical protein
MGQLGNQSAPSVTGNDLLEIHFTRLEVRKVIWEVFVVAYLAMIKDSDQGNLERRGFTWPLPMRGKAGTRRQDPEQKTCRNTAYWLALGFSFPFILFFNWIL